MPARRIEIAVPWLPEEAWPSADAEYIVPPVDDDSHPHGAAAGWDHDGYVRSGEDLGSDHYVHRYYWTPDGKLVGLAADSEVPDGAVFMGLHEHHRNPEGAWCGGYLHFTNVPEAHLADAAYGTESRHQLVQADPLTVAPSLGCRTCSSHGYITEGRWSDVP